MSAHDPVTVALPHLIGARTLLLAALDHDPVERSLALRAAAKIEDVRQLIDPTAGFSVKPQEDDDDDG